MKTFSRLLLGCVLCLTGLSVEGQVTGIELVPTTVHTGAYDDGVDLYGHITYDLLLICSNPNDQISGVFGLESGGETVPNPDAEDWVVETNGCLFQHELGGFNADALNPIFYGTFPSLQYDSYMTMDVSDVDGDGTVQYAFNLPGEIQVTDLFEGPENGDFFDGGTWYIDDGLFFTLFGDPNSECGSDLRYKVAQITTCSNEIHAELCTQVFPLGVQADLVQSCFTLDAPNPCIANPIDPTLAVITPLNCFGETATVGIAAGGNDATTLELYDANTDALVDTQVGLSIGNIGAGDYYIAITDAIGCFDTTEVFSFVEPPELVVTATQTADNLCFGNDIAEVCVDVVGGVTDYVIEAVTADGSVTGINNNECFSGLPCGLFELTVTDENGCFYEESFDISCPSAIAFDLSAQDSPCFGACAGSISGTIAGGTGMLSAEVIDDMSAVVATFEGAAPLDVNAMDLCAGDYTVTVTDENSCQASAPFSLTDPALLETAVAFSNVSCAGECSGSIDIAPTGGTGAIEVFSAELGLGPNYTNVCAGSYEIVTTDEQNCSVTDIVVIDEPDAIDVQYTLTGLACSDACVGMIDVTSITGGGGDNQWTVTLDPPAPSEIDNLPAGYTFSDLCADSYTLNVTDVNFNCTVTFPDLNIDAPAGLEIEATANDISCFGLTDGSIDVSCSGGAGDISIIQPGTAQPCPGNIPDLAAGTYTIVIQDSAGCEADTTVTVAEPDQLVLIITETANPACGNECTGSIGYSYAGGTGDISLLLNNQVVADASPIGGLCPLNEPYVLCAEDINGCEACADTLISAPTPIAIVPTIFPATCTGMCDGSATVLVSGGNGEISLTYDPEVSDLFDLCEGVINVTATDTSGCEVDEDIVITAAIQTDMEITLFSTPESCWETSDGTATAAVTGGEPPIVWLWSDLIQQTTETAIGLESNETYTVTVTDNIGCTLDTSLVVDPNIGCFFIATAVTPNGDGFNDEWVIGGLEYFPDAVVQVYNRWGQLIFESRGYDVPWDGRNNGNPVAVADYYYMIKYNETEDPILGTVTVKY